MEIAKQELIVQAREAASRVLSALSGTCGSGPPSVVLGPPAGAPHTGAVSVSAQTGRCPNGRPWTPGSESSFRG